MRDRATPASDSASRIFRQILNTAHGSELADADRTLAGYEQAKGNFANKFTGSDGNEAHL